MIFAFNSTLMRKRTRNLISRATAFLVGVAFAYACYRSFAVADDLHAPGTRNDPSGNLLAFVAVLATGVPAVALIGFALLPTRVLHKIDPTPASDDLDGSNLGWWWF